MSWKPELSVCYERAMGIEPKNLLLSLADSTPLAPVARSIYGNSPRFWTTVGLRIYQRFSSDLDVCGMCSPRSPSFVQDWARIDGKKCGFPDGCDYSPANFFLAAGRANAFVGPCPLLAITLP